MAAAQFADGSRAFLCALTAEARAALASAEAEITQFPFRIGRESRNKESDRTGFFSEMRKPGNRPNNDLYLIEDGELMNVSREHFQIAREPGGFVLEDRRSTLGTIVEGQTVGGGGKEGRVDLRDGDVIIVGASVSPYVFKFRVR